MYREVAALCYTGSRIHEGLRRPATKRGPATRRRTRANTAVPSNVATAPSNEATAPTNDTAALTNNMYTNAYTNPYTNAYTNPHFSL